MDASRGLRLLPVGAGAIPDEAEETSEAKAVFRHYTYCRVAILVLLKEHESHGAELVSRLAELGFARPAAAGLDLLLGDLEREGLVASTCASSRGGGPPARVYRCTSNGDYCLRATVPDLIKQRNALGVLLERFRPLAAGQR